MARLDAAIASLSDVLSDYLELDTDMRALVRGWQLLDPDARRMVGGLAPELIDAVLRIEHRAKDLVDARRA